jgi:hypothetical protein
MPVPTSGFSGRRQEQPDAACWRPSGAVRVVVLEERNQRGRNGNDLARRHVHVLDAWLGQNGFALFTAGDQVVGQAAFAIQRGVGLRDDVLPSSIADR